MARVRRKKKKTKPRTVTTESTPLTESTQETEEPDLTDEVDAIESLLDEIEAVRTVLPESGPPEDLQEPSPEEFLTPQIQPVKPTRRKEPYRFPEFPQPVAIKPQVHSTRQKPKSVSTKPEIPRGKVKPIPQVKDWSELGKKERERILSYEGELYASIATLDFLTVEFTEHATVPPDKYRRYLRSLLNSVEKAKNELNPFGIGVLDFVEQEGLAQQFPKGIELLKKHIHGALIVPSRDLTQLPRKSAKFVGTCIELIDLLRLGELARVELLLPLLDDLARILESISFIGEDYWSLKTIREWIKTLELEAPETILSENLARMLELQADRWLRDFKDQLDALD